MLAQILAVAVAAAVVTNAAGNAQARPYDAKQSGYKQAKALVLIGDTEYAAKDYKDALKNYDKALSVYEHPVIYKKIALCLNAMGQKKEAMMVYKYSNEMQISGKRP